MIPLGDIIDARLKDVHGRVFHESAGKGATFPYVVYKFPNSTDDFEKEDFILEVDVWGVGENTRDLEELTDDISKALHKYHHYSEGVVQTSVYRINRVAIPDPDRNIRRRQLRFVCKTYLL